LDLLDGVAANEGEVCEAVAFSFWKIKADPLFASVYLLENAFALPVDVEEHLLYALTRLKFGHADRPIALVENCKDAPDVLGCEGVF
jgi:hypothetical protein